MGPLEGLLVKAITFRAASVGRVFYSGGGNPRVLEAATEFATKNSMTTINMTRAGKNLEKLTNGLPEEVSNSMWNRLSAQFARGAKGEVHVFQDAKNLRIDSTWGKIEYPILKHKNVKIIYHIVD